MAENQQIEIKWFIQIKNNTSRASYKEIKVICSEIYDESGDADMEVKTLLKELAKV